ncbi:iron-sulfur cluster-binding domain-containing protein [Levilactobacillus enshiensis]|uniref:iron-sulfur cluster-binding domain-containing protein n=1 Tax=Levilactobacillus enshiensis TaxID=2590213 RepID=UPI00117A2BDD|nr:iron-sulfur cluster-binding domain-containing protein [Levilactobacillus enshiensis]
MTNPLTTLLNERQAHFEAGATTPLPTHYPVNDLAAQLHPETQYLRITNVVDHGADAKSFYFAPATDMGTQHLAYFKAGQYLSVRFNIGQSQVTRAYALRSTPKDALDDCYILTIKLVPKGFVTPYIFAHWQVGTVIASSGPLGQLTYNQFRDQPHVLGIAGGSGITPFLALAGALVDGTENFDLTILYGSRRHDNILLGDELTALADQSPHIKVVNVLSDEDYPGYEHGFITRDLMQQYADLQHTSIFVCGPNALNAYVTEQVAPLHLPGGRLREELSGQVPVPETDVKIPATVTITVQIQDTQQTVTANTREPLLVALERAGIVVPAACRSGECGWCRARVISGQVNTPRTVDHRRAADRKFGYIHLCAAFPESDMTIEVPVHDLADQFG